MVTNQRGHSTCIMALLSGWWCHSDFQMPQQPSNVLSTKILGDLWDVCTIGYPDDILVYSNSLNEHWLHVKEILHWLWGAGLYANPKKCVFHMDMVEYLGFILSPEGLHMDPSKVDAIQSWPEPHIRHDFLMESFFSVNGKVLCQFLYKLCT